MHHNLKDPLSWIISGSQYIFDMIVAINIQQRLKNVPPPPGQKKQDVQTVCVCKFSAFLFF